MYVGVQGKDSGCIYCVSIWGNQKLPSEHDGNCLEFARDCNGFSRAKSTHTFHLDRLWSVSILRQTPEVRGIGVELRGLNPAARKP